MKLLIELSPAELRTAAGIQERIEDLKKELAQLLGGETVAAAPTIETPAPARKGKKKFSAEARAKMAAAQRARRAMERGEPVQPAGVKPEVAPATEGPSKTSKKKPTSDAKLNALAKAREAKLGKGKTAKAKRSKSKKVFGGVPF